jgi:pimeloyl-ACP methyl ester carboxylesterase
MATPANPVYLLKDTFLGYQHSDRKNTRCVVFVHGITGDIKTTWQDDTSKPGFIDLLTHDEELRDYDVFSFGYRSSYIRGAPIDNAAIQLRFALSQLEKDRYNIVLIAHSMGGHR